MRDIGDEAAVQISLDGALGELLRAAVDNPREPDAASCTRIDAVFNYRMASHQHQDWALAEAEELKHRLKAGLLQGLYRSDEGSNKVSVSRPE